MATPGVFVYDAIRTPRGKARGGALHGVKPLDLVVGLIGEIRDRYPGLDPGLIDDVVLGVVSPVGDQGANIARTAALAAGLPVTVGGVQINRFCSSGLEAVNLAAAKVASGWDQLVLAGGVESMSRVPMSSDGGALAMDPATNYDLFFVPQGIGADLIATTEGFSREDVDTYSVTSQQRAERAWSGGYFADAVVPVRDMNGTVVLDHDEHRRPRPPSRASARCRLRLPRSVSTAGSTRSHCRSTTSGGGHRSRPLPRQLVRSCRWRRDRRCRLGGGG